MFLDIILFFWLVFLLFEMLDLLNILRDFST